jgi:hypothetical protein
MPNPDHPDTEVMIALEARLGRPRFNLPSRGEFESETRTHFAVDRIDDAPLMIKYLRLSGSYVIGIDRA